MVRQVDLGTFCAQMGPQDRHAVQQALANGMGMARFGDKTVSYGTRDAYIPGLPPKVLDGSELGDFVAPTPTAATMRSPLLDAVGGPPQITRPRVAPSTTERPDIQFEARTSPHPRGSNGYINVERLRPGREPGQVLPSEPLSPEAEWWAERLGSQR